MDHEGKAKTRRETV